MADTADATAPAYIDNVFPAIAGEGEGTGRCYFRGVDQKAEAAHVVQVDIMQGYAGGFVHIDAVLGLAIAWAFNGQILNGDAAGAVDANGVAVGIVAVNRQRVVLSIDGDVVFIDGNGRCIIAD